MRRDLLPLSIFTLAFAVTLHAIVPAYADDPPPAAAEPVAEVAPEKGGMAPQCKVIRLGTAKEFVKVMGTLYEEGATEFEIVGSGLVCGWN